MSYIVAIIPARGNSKSIPNKNLQKLGDHSLLGLAILSAQRSECFDEIIVTTDNEKIAKEASLYGATVILRPDHLAADNAKSIDAVIHVLETLKVSSGISVLLQPTSPFRNSSHILDALKCFEAVAANSVVSVCESDSHPYKMLVKFDDEFEPVKDIHLFESPRQSLPKSYLVNGAIYINDIAKLLDCRSFFNAPLSYYEMGRIESMDIDYTTDLDNARSIFDKMNLGV
ncbi:MAG: acylneuraminate cytidylyltransferase family protein [Pseudomonadota bacterium]|nr:acylneuraminate cytidylyltransferase family protein [Pseudomonadota bacterium]